MFQFRNQEGKSLYFIELEIIELGKLASEVSGKLSQVQFTDNNFFEFAEIFLPYWRAGD